jgi:hypothetical protein
MDEKYSGNLEPLFNITKEVLILSAIRDVQDELNILDHVLDDQHEALLQLLAQKKNSLGNLRSDHTQSLNHSVDESTMPTPVVVDPATVSTKVSVDTGFSPKGLRVSGWPAKLLE